MSMTIENLQIAMAITVVYKTETADDRLEKIKIRF